MKKSITINNVTSTKADDLDEYLIGVIDRWKDEKPIINTNFVKILSEMAGMYAFLIQLMMKMSSHVRQLKTLGLSASDVSIAMQKKVSLELTVKAIKMLWDSVSRTHTILNMK